MDFQVQPCTITATEGGFRIVFAGPIHTNTSWLERELTRVVAAKPKDVELDLTGTEYISSLGLGILVGFHNRIKENGGVVRIVKILKPTLRLLKAAYLDRVLTIEPAAIAATEQP